MKFGQELTAYGENLAEDLELPKNTSTTTDGRKLGGTMGSVEMLARVVKPVKLAAGKNLTITVQHSDTDADYQPTGWVFSLAAPDLGTDASITRFCFPSTSKKYVRCIVATDDPTAVGSVALDIVYLPR